MWVLAESSSCIFPGLRDQAADIPTGDGKNVIANVTALFRPCLCRGHFHWSPWHIGKRTEAQGHKHSIKLRSVSLSRLPSPPPLFILPPVCVSRGKTVKWKCRALSLPFHVKHFYCVTIDFFPLYNFFLIWRYKAGRKGRLVRFKREHFKSPLIPLRQHTLTH